MENKEEQRIEVLLDFLEGNIRPSTIQEVFKRLNEKLADDYEEIGI